MFSIQRMKALQDNTPSRNLTSEFINAQGSFPTFDRPRKRRIFFLSESCTSRKGAFVYWNLYAIPFMLDIYAIELVCVHVC